MEKKYKTFKELQKAVNDFINDRNWVKYHDPKNLSMAISIEAAELMELLLWYDNETAIKKSSDTSFKEEISDEIADIIIYCSSLANFLEIDIGTIAANKISKNKLKYSIKKSQQVSKEIDDINNITK